MKIFISWSGDKSLAVAELLKLWLPSVLQALSGEVWLSDEDIRSGANWSATIGEKLSTTDYGIVCVTQHNQDRPWLNFEAGAISKLVGGCVPLLIDFPSKSDLNAGPMSQLQVRMANRQDIERLVRDMNGALEKPLAPEVLTTSLNRAFPEFEQAMELILKNPGYATTPAKRESEDKLDEVLTLVRELAKSQPLPRMPRLVATPEPAVASTGPYHFPLVSKKGTPVAPAPIHRDEARAIARRVVGELGLPSDTVRLHLANNVIDMRFPISVHVSVPMKLIESFADTFPGATFRVSGDQSIVAAVASALDPSETYRRIAGYSDEETEYRMRVRKDIEP